MCVSICLCIKIDFNMNLRKLMSDFHIISNLFLSVYDLVSGFLELQLQLNITKVTIVHIFLFENPSETSSQFTFHSCCLSLLTVSYPF